MAEAKVYPVRLNGGPTVVLLSVDELIEAAEEGRLAVASGPGEEGEPAANPNPTGVHERVFDPAARSIEKLVQELAAQVPDEEWESLPPDLSEQHDHYIYGTPKR